MSISDLCSKEVVCVESNATLQFAAQMMQKHHVGALVVVKLNGIKKPIGILTDRDIVLGVVTHNLPIDSLVNEVMSKNPVTVAKTDGIAEVTELMKKNNIRRVIVQDENGNACGLVSSDNILQLLAHEMADLAKTTEVQVRFEKSFKPRNTEAIV